MDNNYHIIIIGAGTAGMACAITAAARGLQVLAIEKASEVGGTLHLTAGHLSAGGTKLQASKGIADNPAQHYQDVKRISRNTMHPLIGKMATDLAPSTIDWLQTLGFPFHPNAPLIIHGHEPYCVARTYLGVNDYAAKDITGSGKTILHTLLPLWQKYMHDGLITFMPNHSLQGFKNEENSLKYIYLKHTNGKAITIPVLQAKVVVTTGGYASNPNLYTQLMAQQALPTQHYPKRLLSSAAPYSMGDGIVALQKIGALCSGAQHHLSTLGGVELEPSSGRTSFWDAWARVSNSHDRPPREIYVNENGNRFMNEQDLTVDQRERIVLQQPNQRFYVLFDHTALYSGSNIVVQWSAEQFIQEAQKEKCCWQANTIEEMATKINVPTSNLLQTIMAYNKATVNGIDEAFGRTLPTYALTQAPYYALLVYAYSLISFGGIQVNEKLQVLNSDGVPITNAFAAGEILGAAATSGNSFCGGMLLTPALSFGRWLGDTL